MRCAWVMLVVASAVTAAGEPQWRVVNPSNSGIPGEEVRLLRWAPDGKLWVAARWPFWQDGGIGIYDFATDVWTVYSKGEYPIPSEYINDIKFDASGAAWIATDRGLVRFDGQNWTVWNPTNSPMLLYKVRNLSIAPDGHIWVNNSDFNAGGDAIFDFDGVSAWRRYQVPDQLPWEAPWTDLSSVLVDHLGHVWVANDTLSGLAEFDGTTWRFRGGPTRFSGLVEDVQGNIWMRAGVGGGNAFYKYDRTSFATYPISTTPLAIGIDDDGAVYTGDWNGNVRRTTNGGQSWSLFLTGLNQVAQIAPDPAGGDVWIGTFGAVGHFRGDGSWVRDYNTWNTGFPDYFVDYMMTTAEGMFWVATGEAGLSRFDGLRWRNWGNHNAGSEPYPFAGNEPMGGAFQDRQGRFWFGGNGIAEWDAATGLFSGFWNWQNNPGMGVTMFPFFAQDAAGNVFAATEYGAVYRFDEEDELWLREPVNPYAVMGLPNMRSDSLGNVWIAAWFAVHKWDGQSWSTVPLPYNDYFFDLGGINDFAIDRDDTLWFATEGGVVHYDGAAFTLYDSSNTPLPTPEVKSIAVRSDGLLALSASRFQSTVPFPNGVAVIDGDIADPASWSVWTYQDSPIPHYQLGRVAFDGQGDLWVSAISEGCAVLDLPPPSRPGDLDGDGDVDFQDLVLLLTAYGVDAGGDVDGDGDTDFDDLVILLTNYGV